MGQASRTRARLAREQWNDYKKRFAEYEDRLVDLATSGPSEMVNRARTNASAQYGAGLDIGLRQEERYGAGGGYDAREQRANSVGGALAKVDAANSARDAYESQQLGLMTGNFRNNAGTAPGG